MNNVWRLNIKTGSEDWVDPRIFCISRNILGVGWRIDFEGEVNWDQYYKNAMERYYNHGDHGWWPAIKAIKERMQIGDLCWTRDLSGVYYLGRIVSDWHYRGENEYLAADVVNTRECIWLKIGNVDSVPGKIVNSFIPSRTVQAVHDDSVSLYSQFIYNKLSRTNYYTLPNNTLDLFSIISAEDCEDIVGVFLQERGYRIIPSSCKTDTAAYEFVLKHRENEMHTVVQVKQGNTNLNIGDYSTLENEVYLLTTNGKYVGESSSNVHCLNPEELKLFATKNRSIMSDRVKVWLDWIEHIKTNTN